MLKKVNIILAVSSAAIVGCSSAILQTSSIPERIISSDSSDQDRVGSIYYLPKALIPISIKLKGAGGDSKPNGNNASAQVTNNITINGTKTTDNSAKNNNKGTKAEKKEFQYTFSFGDLKYIPDTNAAYFLEHNDNIFFDDNITIEVGNNQLLKSVDSVATDQTGEVLIKLTELAATVAKMSVGVPTPTKKEFLTESEGDEEQLHYVCTLPEITSLDTILDPGISEARVYNAKAVNNSLAALHLPINITVSPPVNVYKNETDEEQPYPKLTDQNKGFSARDLLEWDGCTSFHNCISKGVLVRSPVPYFITVDVTKNINQDRFYRIASSEEIEDNTIDMVKDPKECLSKFEVKETSQTFLVMAPNDGPITSVDVSRASFVSKTTKLGITNGMLQKIEMEKPSQALGFIRIPVDMAKAVAEIPGSILSFQIKNTQDEASFYKEQINLLTQMEELKKKQEEISAPSP